MANGIYDLIQQGTETAKRYAQLGTPIYNFAKAFTVGPSEAYISDTMRDQLVQKAKETELDKGTLGYEDFGLPVTTEGGRFTGGLFDLAANDPVAFGNVGSVGRVSFEKDPTQPGGYKFGSTEFDFNVSDTDTDFGSNLLRGINEGGLKTAIPNVSKDLVQGFKNLFTPTTAVAAELPSSQKYSQQFSVTQPSQFDTRQVPQVPGTDVMQGSIVGDVVDTPTREFGQIRGGPESGAFGVRGISQVQDLPVDFSELDDLDSDAENEEIQDLIAQAQQEERRGALETLKAFGKDVGSRALISNILQGAGTVIGGPVVGTVAGITGLLRGPDILNQINRPGTPGFGVSRPGNTLTAQTIANRSQFDDFYSGFRGGAQNQMGRRVDDVLSRLSTGRRTRSDAAAFVDKYGSQEQKQNFGIAKGKASAIAQEKANRDYARGDSDGGGGGKIVCTMMNESYGFGNFRNKIWLRQSKDLAPEYQKGYHILFLPLVKIAKTNKIVKKVLEHIAVHRTIDIRQESRGKTHMLGRLYRKVLEPICYWVGKYAKR